MIVIDNLSKSFGDKVVLDKLSCQIEENSIYGIIGVNGAGKSTLLRIINGIYKQNSGTVTIDGENIVDNEDLKQEIAFVPDEFYFFYGYKLIDLAKFYQALYKKFDMNRFNNLIKIDADAFGMKLYGYCGKPYYTKHNKNYQTIILMREKDYYV